MQTLNKNLIDFLLPRSCAQYKWPYLWLHVQSRTFISAIPRQRIGSERILVFDSPKITSYSTTYSPKGHTLQKWTKSYSLLHCIDTNETSFVRTYKYKIIYFVFPHKSSLPIIVYFKFNLDQHWPKVWPMVPFNFIIWNWSRGEYEDIEGCGVYMIDR